MPWIEIAAIVLSLLYIFFAIRNKVICFVFGLIASFAWAYVTYINYNLVFDAILQGFYAGMSILGIYKWTKGVDQQNELPIQHMSFKDHLLTLVLGVVLGFFMAYVTGFFLEASWAYLDSLTTVFLMIATYYLVERKLENWIYFIVADMIYIYIYWSQGAELFAYMMVVYTIMAIIGYVQWRKQMTLDSI